MRTAEALVQLGRARGPGSGVEASRFIHLLYAPTNFCNLGCQYCYLGDGTDVPTAKRSPLATLEHAVQLFLADGIVPFNLSFHGGEPTAITEAHLEQLLDYATRHYARFGPQIRRAGFPANPVHIKTNLFNFHQRRALFEQYAVSISASVDLPLSLHGLYRTDKQGGSTLTRTVDNLRLLASYPHHKKISCVVTRAHFERVDELVRDIRFLHDDIGLDMTRFNVMFSFDSHKSREKFGPPSPGLTMLTQDQQVLFYQRLDSEFRGTDLEAGLRQHWFKEFTPEFCCSAVNCGDKFFLLQENGDVYSCPRGQSSRRFRYGNVFEQPIGEIVANGTRAIEVVENALPLHADCQRCEYLPYCNTGCSFVREEARTEKSYTCKLQKALYRADPGRYPPYAADDISAHARHLRFRNNIKSISMSETEPRKARYVTNELDAEENSLAAMVEQDPVLHAIYSPGLFVLYIDGLRHELESATLKNLSELALIRSDSEVSLTIRKDAFDLSCREPVNNYVQVMLLRNTLVRYGDEKRLKQEHLADYSIYQRSLIASSSETTEGWCFDLMPWLSLHRGLFLDGVSNNLFVTTRSLREYHYRKQEKNAFYHVQAINLPLAHQEFHWKTADGV